MDAYRVTLARRRYTKATAKGYCNLFRRFLHHLHPSLPETLSAAEVQAYVDAFAAANGLSPATKATVAKALRLYYEAAQNGATRR